MSIRKIFFTIPFLILISLSNNAGAGFVCAKAGCYDFVTTNGGSLTTNRAYAGLKWTLNEGIKPQAVFGFRHARTESNGDTDGGDISISAKFIDGFQLGKLRAKYFNGKEQVQGVPFSLRQRLGCKVVQRTRRRMEERKRRQELLWSA